MSSCLTPRTTSNGASGTVAGSSAFTSGTTVTRPASTTPHVSVRVKCSPSCTAFALVFHQHMMGSDATSPGPGALGRAWAAAGALAGAWAVAGGASHAPDATTITTTPTRTRQDVLNLLVMRASIVPIVAAIAIFCVN